MEFSIKLNQSDIRNLLISGLSDPSLFPSLELIDLHRDKYEKHILSLKGNEKDSSKFLSSLGYHPLNIEDILYDDRVI
jgi:hypothetical protein